eukprot:5437753-Pleurochrysis_carterae.AAC.1
MELSACSELATLADTAEKPNSAASGDTEAIMESKMNPENGSRTESHLNSSFLSAAAISRPADSGSVLRFFKQYLNHLKRPTDFLPAPSPFPLPFRANAADGRLSVFSQAGATR